MFRSHFTGLSQPVFKSVALCLALFSFACSTVPFKLKHTPTTEADFRLPPEELKSKFADVEGLHPWAKPKYIHEDPGGPLEPGKTDPSSQDVIDHFGEPGSTRIITRSPLEVLANPFTTLGSISFVASPVVGGLLLGISAGAYLFASPQQELSWRKGDYAIRATMVSKNKELFFWEWDYVTTQPTEKFTPLVDPTRSSTYWQWNASLPSYIPTEDTRYEHAYWGIGYGKSFYPKSFVDNVHIDALNSLQSFSRGTVEVIGVSHFITAMSFTKDFNHNKNEIGLGVWYDTRLSKAITDRYKGKIGAFAEIKYLNSPWTEHVLRVGYVRFVQDGIASRQHFARVQLLTRFRGKQAL